VQRAAMPLWQMLCAARQDMVFDEYVGQLGGSPRCKLMGVSERAAVAIGTQYISFFCMRDLMCNAGWRGGGELQALRRRPRARRIPSSLKRSSSRARSRGSGSAHSAAARDDRSGEGEARRGRWLAAGGNDLAVCKSWRHIHLARGRSLD